MLVMRLPMVRLSPSSQHRALDCVDTHYCDCSGVVVSIQEDVHRKAMDICMADDAAQFGEKYMILTCTHDIVAPTDPHC